MVSRDLHGVGDVSDRSAKRTLCSTVRRKKSRGACVSTSWSYKTLTLKSGLFGKDDFELLLWKSWIE